MIPKIIHYCWFGGKALPDSVEKCISTWKKYCPDYKIKRWDETNFDFTCNQFVKAAYEDKYWAFVSDYARLKIIYEEGGIYLDTDVELLKNLDNLLALECFVAEAQEGNLNTGLGFGAVKNCYMIGKMLEEYGNVRFNRNDLLTGPVLNTRALEKEGYVKGGSPQTISGATIFPPKYFDPFSPSTSSNLLCSDTYSIHHYDASWTGGLQKAKRRLVQRLGEENIVKLKRLREGLFNKWPR